MAKCGIYKCIRREPESAEFAKLTSGIALMLKKHDGKIAVINAISEELLWMTTDVQEESRSEDKIHLTAKTVNSVYEFEKIGELY